jgi:carbon-monoxide dehydrogenase catalytic subunit
MLEKLLQKVAADEIQELAREKGAAGIVVGGMCCTGHETLARHGVPTVAGAMGQEFALGTGAVDAFVMDMQCVVPGVQAVAECFGTEIVTTCRSNRVAGATHIPFDPENPETLDEDAERIARLAIENYAARDRSEIHIPDHTSTVMAGFSRESILDSFDGVKHLWERLVDGEIRGIVAMVGCTTPKVPYETGHVRIAERLVEQGVLVLASGCSAHALLNAGMCSPEAAAKAPIGLRTALEAAGIPPVLAVGACADNARIIQVFAALAHEARLPMPDMPFAVSGPELANEKTMGQLLAVLAHGLTSVVGLSPMLPIPTIGPTLDAAEAGAGRGANVIAEFFGGEGLHSMVGSRLFVQPDPAIAAETILSVLDGKRDAWRA